MTTSITGDPNNQKPVARTGPQAREVAIPSREVNRKDEPATGRLSPEGKVVPAGAPPIGEVLNKSLP